MLKKRGGGGKAPGEVELKHQDDPGQNGQKFVH